MTSRHLFHKDTQVCCRPPMCVPPCPAGRVLGFRHAYIVAVVGVAVAGGSTLRCK
jgi:hypothetical protein